MGFSFGGSVSLQMIIRLCTNTNISEYMQDSLCSKTITVHGIQSNYYKLNNCTHKHTHYTHTCIYKRTRVHSFIRQTTHRERGENKHSNRNRNSTPNQWALYIRWNQFLVSRAKSLAWNRSIQKDWLLLNHFLKYFYFILLWIVDQTSTGALLFERKREVQFVVFSFQWILLCKKFGENLEILKLDVI